MKFVLFFISLVVFCACGDDPAKTPVATIRKEQLTGKWRNVYMRLEMESYKNTDSLRVLEVSENNWEQKMGIRPITTYYWYDGTYNSEHYNLKDSLFYNPAGHWILRNDTVIMTDTFPKPGVQYRYQLVINGNMAEFTGVEDLDGDGKADDRYYGLQRKFR